MNQTDSLAGARTCRIFLCFISVAMFADIICFILTLSFRIDPLFTSTSSSGPHPSFLGKSTHLLLGVGISSSDTPLNVLEALGSEGVLSRSLTSDSKVIFEKNSQGNALLKVPFNLIP